PQHVLRADHLVGCHISCPPGEPAGPAGARVTRVAPGVFRISCSNRELRAATPALPSTRAIARAAPPWQATARYPRGVNFSRVPSSGGAVRVGRLGPGQWLE